MYRPNQSNNAIPDQIKAAISHYHSGQLKKSAKVCQQVLKSIPNEPNCLHLLGVIEYQGGNYRAAVTAIQKAIAASPEIPDYYNTLGNVLRAQGRLEDAASQYQKVLSMAPQHFVALNNMANVMVESVRYDDALSVYEHVLKLKPDYAEAYLGMGNALHGLGRDDQAMACYERALGVRPRYAEVYGRMAEMRSRQGRLEEAIEYFRKSLEINPNVAAIWNNLGNALQNNGALKEAMECFRRALTLQPGNAEMANNLGNALKDAGQLKEAVTFLRQALAAKPDFAKAHNNLANALLAQGALQEAVASYRRALELQPDLVDTFSNYLYALNYDPEYTREQIFAEHKRYAQYYEAPLCALVAPHFNMCGTRRLRIGYVSGDFRNHSVAYFIEPILANHDAGQFEVYCYYNHSATDAVTRRLQGQAHQWRNIAALSDDEVAQQIRADQIDILVDLSGHTAMNRLLVFARKPAPIQATWLGYLNTTGLSAMDYRITDEFATPPGEADQYHTEKLLRLPAVQGCYQAPESSPEVGTCPFEKQGHVTFGSFNSLAKITPEVMAAWADILKAVPGSRLVMMAQGLEHKIKPMTAQLVKLGVDANRIRLLGFQPFSEYLKLHQEVDIHLDSFPYTGGTVTCHALWMGVPVISLVGETVTSRNGASILTAVGIGDLVATDKAGYIRLATELAADTDRLQSLRAELRPRLKASPLMNPQQVTRELEQAYQTIWETWCQEQQA